MYYVYVLKLKNTKKNFYFGCTSDLRRRMVEHGNGSTKSTKGRNPKLIYHEAYKNKHLAFKRERGLKNSGSVYIALLKRIGEK